MFGRTNIRPVKNGLKGDPSRAVRLTFEGCTLPTEVWIACTPHHVSAFEGSVRRCTKCQAIGHTKSQCRSRVTRCSRCGAGGQRWRGAAIPLAASIATVAIVRLQAVPRDVGPRQGQRSQEQQLHSILCHVAESEGGPARRPGFTRADRTAELQTQA